MNQAAKNTAKFSRLRAKAFRYLLDDRSEDKKVKDKKKCLI